MEETVEKVKDFDQRLMARQLELVLLKTKVLQRESLRLNLSLNCRSVSFDSWSNFQGQEEEKKTGTQKEIRCISDPWYLP